MYAARTTQSVAGSDAILRAYEVSHEAAETCGYNIYIQRAWACNGFLYVYGRSMTHNYTRSFTYGQVKGIHGLIRLLKDLGVRHRIEKISFVPTASGQPGSPDTYRVRFRYEDYSDL